MEVTSVDTAHTRLALLLELTLERLEQVARLRTGVPDAFFSCQCSVFFNNFCLAACSCPEAPCPTLLVRMLFPLRALVPLKALLSHTHVKLLVTCFVFRPLPPLDATRDT